MVQVSGESFLSHPTNMHHTLRPCADSGSLAIERRLVYACLDMSNTVHTCPIAEPADARKEALALWDRNRLRCGWFLREDFTPRTRDEFVRCLDMLAQHGDRATYVLARKLLRCL